MNVLPLALYLYKYVLGHLIIGFSVCFSYFYSSPGVSIGVTFG